ncbi:CYTH domain-containing protein [Streptomyces sp. NBC_01261]|uniref:CYTH domain-containing protein n=1 Tax=unclassified Streptomyces TaxID=2593676 RepID=UPI002E29DE77|nr:MULTISPECIES: CYTH domain-containing protein [unclassified Streptomyces]
MPTEIERKFTAPADGPFTDVPAIPVEQGYLVRADGAHVRIRKSGGAHTLTVKKGRGLTRQEFEIDISTDDFDLLWPATEGARVTKTRRLVPLSDGRTACVDEFAAQLAGLVMVEVEFSTEDEARRFRPPAWFGTEVTEDVRYSNSVLVTAGRPVTDR